MSELCLRCGDRGHRITSDNLPLSEPKTTLAAFAFDVPTSPKADIRPPRDQDVCFGPTDQGIRAVKLAEALQKPRESSLKRWASISSIFILASGESDLVIFVGFAAETMSLNSRWRLAHRGFVTPRTARVWSADGSRSSFRNYLNIAPRPCPLWVEKRTWCDINCGAI